MPPRGPLGHALGFDQRLAQRLERYRVAAEKLCWRCPPAIFDFKSTREVSPSRGFLGQRKPLEAIRMAMAMESPGYNLFLCGLNGSSKMALVERYVRRLFRSKNAVPDRCYVQNFDDPRRPKLLELPTGQGYRLQADIAHLLNCLHAALEKTPERRWRSRARSILAREVPRLHRRYPFRPVTAWLEQWKRALLATIRHVTVEDFEVNCLGQPPRGRGAKVVVETNPTHANLFGWIGRRGSGDQTPTAHFTEIRRGAFLEADGGVLVLDANDAYSAHGAWATLKNCLKYGTLEIQDGDPSTASRSGVLKPEPIMTRVKLVLVGDYPLYDHLFENDPDFQEVFKIRVDFESEMALTPHVLRRDYPAFIAGLCEDEELRPVSASGLARLVEYAVRKAGRKTKITAQSWVIADLLREADYWAGKAHRRLITRADVERAIAEAIDRVNLVEKKIAEMISEGTILISTSGTRVGQVNGLAIYDMGDYFFGKPSRITSETSVGHGGIISIERESGFSGRSHDKGVQILAGYLRSCFAQSRPLSLTASVCFEQSYSGIDGDSASATEIYAILSSLSGLPIRQDIAVTGSLSQKGDIQPIGGVNEKIEGFFDCVQAGRPSGREGVIIPRKNVGDLMLRADVVKAVDEGRFHIYAIDNVAEGLEILTGVPAGRRQRNGRYPPGSAFDRVDRRLESLASDLRRYSDSGNGAQ
jgi:lon-related putative ATP-dependent protease